MWDRPDELIGRADVDKHIQEPPHKKGPEDGKKTGVDTRTLWHQTVSRDLYVKTFLCGQVSIRRSQSSLPVLTIIKMLSQPKLKRGSKSADRCKTFALFNNAIRFYL